MDKTYNLYAYTVLKCLVRQPRCDTGAHTAHAATTDSSVYGQITMMLFYSKQHAARLSTEQKCGETVLQQLDASQEKEMVKKRRFKLEKNERKI